MLLQGILTLFALVVTAAQDLQDILNRMEDEVLAFRDYVESRLEERCHDATLANCFGANYDTYFAEYRNQMCPESLGEGTILDTPECRGNSNTDSKCNGLFMFNDSSFQLMDKVGLNEFGKVVPKAMESVCFSRLLEQNMIDRYRNLSEYWSTNLGVDEKPFVYLGMSDSTFRIFPSRQHHVDDYNSYDPRVRPWYIASRSGPKDVILILDYSGSRQDPSDIRKAAALTVLDSLGENDRVGIIKLDENPSLLPPANFSKSLVEATQQNKIALRKAIKELEPSGQPNVSGAFDVAFDAFDRTIDAGVDSECNSAILFFTNGEIQDVDRVVDLIDSRKSNIVNRGNFMTFTYEIGTMKTESDARNFACRTRGLWARVVSANHIEEGLSSYYKFFAFGSGRKEEGNERSVFWVDPYKFEPSGFGTTVSSPVYDRSIHPPVFVGVVAIDISVPAMEKALPGGQKDFVRSAIRNKVRESRVCPADTLNDCQLESLRRETLEDFEEAVCQNACINETELLLLEPPRCPYHGSKDSYEFKSLLVNTHNEGKSFEERVCCTEGKTGPSDTCAADDPIPTSVPTAQPTVHPTSVPSSTTTTTTQEDDPDNSSFVDMGFFIGILIGIGVGILFTILVANLVVVMLGKRNQNQKNPVPASQNGVPPEVDLPEGPFQQEMASRACTRSVEMREL